MKKLMEDGSTGGGGTSSGAVARGAAGGEGVTTSGDMTTSADVAAYKRPLFAGLVQRKWAPTFAVPSFGKWFKKRNKKRSTRKPVD